MYKKAPYAICQYLSNGLLYFNAATGKEAFIPYGKAPVLEQNPFDIAYITSKLDSKYYNSLICAGIIVENELEQYRMIEQYRDNDWASERTLHVTILPTEFCNFACTYCYQDHNAKWMTDETMSATVKFITRQLTNFDTLHLAWFGGEPLCASKMLCKSMRQIAMSAAVQKVKLHASMTTNGYLLSPELFAELYSYGIYGYQITLDGPENIHDKFRHLRDGGGTYVQIIENLKYIKNNSQFSKARVLLRINLTQKLVNELEAFIRDLGELFGNDDRFSVDLQNVSDLGGEGINTMRSELISEPPNAEGIAHLLEKYGFPTIMDSASVCIGGQVCDASRHNSYVIGVDGSVKKCTAALYDEANNVGYIDSEGILHINEKNHRLWHEFESCKEGKNCELYPICYSRACPYVALRYDQIKCPKEAILNSIRNLRSCRRDEEILSQI